MGVGDFDRRHKIGRDRRLKLADRFKLGVATVLQHLLCRAPVHAGSERHLMRGHAFAPVVGADPVQEFVGGHALSLHRNANFASPMFASRCNRTLHRNAQNTGMNAVQDERDRLQKALAEFYKSAEEAGLIRSVNAWAKASQLSTSTINPVIKGTANKRLEDETYFKLADGASKLMGRSVSVEELKGEAPKAVVLTERQRRALAALDGIPEDRQDEEIAVLETRAALLRKGPEPPPQGA